MSVASYSLMLLGVKWSVGKPVLHLFSLTFNIFSLLNSVSASDLRAAELCSFFRIIFIRLLIILYFCFHLVIVITLAGSGSIVITVVNCL